MVDSSALVAVLLEESDGDRIAHRMAQADGLVASVANILEVHMVMSGHRRIDDLDAMLDDLNIKLRPITEAQLTAARAAHDRFGRGNHPARLNFGDCFAYALAKTSGHPLLFKGNDFALTDVEAVIY